ncbi:hypothetical protein D3C85_1215000 [compost metagenome]
MPFSVMTLIREPGIFESASIWVLILVVSQASLLRASSEEGAMTCNSLWTFFTRCTELAACSAVALRSARGVCPASSTMPLKLLTTMCEFLSRSGLALATLTATLVSIKESSILLPKVRVPRSSSIGASREALITELQPLRPRHRVRAIRPRRLGVILHSRTIGCRSSRRGSGSPAGGLPGYVR